MLGTDIWSLFTSPAVKVLGFNGLVLNSDSLASHELEKIAWYGTQRRLCGLVAEPFWAHVTLRSCVPGGRLVLDLDPRGGGPCLGQLAGSQGLGRGPANSFHLSSQEAVSEAT